MESASVATHWKSAQCFYILRAYYTPSVATLQVLLFSEPCYTPTVLPPSGRVLPQRVLLFSERYHTECCHTPSVTTPSVATFRRTNMQSTWQDSSNVLPWRLLERYRQFLEGKLPHVTRLAKHSRAHALQLLVDDAFPEILLLSCNTLLLSQWQYFPRKWPHSPFQANVLRSR